MDPTQRFSTKAQVYARYRQDFAPEAIAALVTATGLTRTATVLDVGAGTGMLTRHLLGHFDCVYALEPNFEMRQAAEAALIAFPGFHLLAARAEEIPLSYHSVDLITAGRVLHWLQPKPTRAEFWRIAKPGTWLAVVRLNMLDEPFLEAMRALRIPEYGFRPRGEEAILPGNVDVEFYFAGETCETITFQHTHRQNFESFLGGVQSGSYAPDESHSRYGDFRLAAERVFDHLSADGILSTQLATEIHLGQINPK